MCAHGSPTGSPTAGVGMALDRAEVAQPLIDATEAASQAGMAAVQMATQQQVQAFQQQMRSHGTVSHWRSRPWLKIDLHSR